MSLSASSLERVEACPASTALPAAQYSGIAAETGTENHRVIEDVINAGGVPEKLRHLWEDPETGSPPRAVHTEIAYVVDVSTRKVRRLGKLKSHRDYGKLGGTEIATTLDVEIVHDNAVNVIDWKSRERTTPAERNVQIATQVCAVETHYGKPVHAGLVYLDDWYADMASFSIFDSGERWSRLARIVAASGSGSPKMGSHCKYCPAMVSCPAHRATLAAMLDVGVAVEQMTPELVGEAWTKLKAIESMAERVDFAIRERARREPIPLPNGKHLRLVESSRTSQDAKAMAERLRALGEDPEKFKKTTTYTQVREGTNK